MSKEEELKMNKEFERYKDELVNFVAQLTSGKAFKSVTQASKVLAATLVYFVKQQRESEQFNLPSTGEHILNDENSVYFGKTKEKKNTDGKMEEKPLEKIYTEAKATYKTLLTKPTDITYEQTIRLPNNRNKSVHVELPLKMKELSFYLSFFANNENEIRLIVKKVAGNDIYIKRSSDEQYVETLKETFERFARNLEAIEKDPSKIMSYDVALPYTIVEKNGEKIEVVEIPLLVEEIESKLSEDMLTNLEMRDISLKEHLMSAYSGLYYKPDNSIFVFNYVEDFDEPLSFVMLKRTNETIDIWKLEYDCTRIEAGLSKDEFIHWHEYKFSMYGNLYSKDEADGTTEGEMINFINSLA